MKKLVWIAGLLLALSIAFPNGISLPKTKPAVTLATPDKKIVGILRNADAADKARIVSVYEGLRAVVSRDKGSRVNTTDKLAELQSRTLELAIETPGKYTGLDDAIEFVFSNTVSGPDSDIDASVVQAVTPELQARLVKACDVIIASAQ